MTTETTDIKSIEEYSLFALDRSAEGLDNLCEESRECGRTINSNDTKAFALVSNLAVNLHDFDIFQNDLSDFLMLDTDAIYNQAGSLTEIQGKFKAILEDMAARIGVGNMTGLAQILCDELPDVLTRFKALLPLVREYIHNEYLQTA